MVVPNLGLQARIFHVVLFQLCVEHIRTVRDHHGNLRLPPICWRRRFGRLVLANWRRRRARLGPLHRRDYVGVSHLR